MNCWLIQNTISFTFYTYFLCVCAPVLESTKLYWWLVVKWLKCCSKLAIFKYTTSIIRYYWGWLYCCMRESMVAAEQSHMCTRKLPCFAEISSKNILLLLYINQYNFFVRKKGFTNLCCWINNFILNKNHEIQTSFKYLAQSTYNFEMKHCNFTKYCNTCVKWKTLIQIIS